MIKFECTNLRKVISILAQLQASTLKNQTDLQREMSHVKKLLGQPQHFDPPIH